MGNVISNLKARFGVDTSDFKKGLKDGEKATDDFKDAAGGALQEFASMFGVNMSAVNDALGTAHKSMKFLGESFTGAAKGGNILTISMNFLKTALISTGLGAIVVVLGSIISYFSKTGEGADKFAKILAQVKSVVNNVIERLANFGKGLWEIMTGKFKQGWETMTSAFKGMGTEIKEDWKAAGNLADAEDALEDRERKLITSLSERKAKIAELRLQAKEEQEDQKKKLLLLKEAEALTKGIYSDQLSIEEERLRIMKEKLALQTKDPTDEQLDEIAFQEAKINELYRDRATELKGIVREKSAALKIVNDEIALEKKKAEQIAITNASIANVKIPDLNKIVSNALAPLAKVQEVVKTITQDITQTIEGAFESMAVGMGEFLGNLIIGNAGIEDLFSSILSILADAAISIGTAAIAIGVAFAAIQLGWLTPAGAIIAGIALVAIGTAIKGSLANAAAAKKETAAEAIKEAKSSSGNIYDTRKSQSIDVNITGRLVGEGKDLVAVISKENNRLGMNT